MQHTVRRPRWRRLPRRRKHTARISRALGLGSPLTTRYLLCEPETGAHAWSAHNIHSYAILPIGKPASNANSPARANQVSSSVRSSSASWWRRSAYVALPTQRFWLRLATEEGGQTVDGWCSVGHGNFWSEAGLPGLWLQRLLHCRQDCVDIHIVDRQLLAGGSGQVPVVGQHFAERQGGHDQPGILPVPNATPWSAHLAVAMPRPGPWRRSPGARRSLRNWQAPPVRARPGSLPSPRALKYSRLPIRWFMSSWTFHSAHGVGLSNCSGRTRGQPHPSPSPSSRASRACPRAYFPCPRALARDRTICRHSQRREGMRGSSRGVPGSGCQPV